MFAGVRGQLSGDFSRFDKQILKDCKYIVQSGLKKGTRTKTVMAGLRILTFGVVAGSFLAGISAVVSGSIVTGVLPSMISMFVFRDIFFLNANVEANVIDDNAFAPLQNVVAEGVSLSELGKDGVKKMGEKLGEKVNEFVDKAKIVKDNVLAHAAGKSLKQRIIAEAYESKTVLYCERVHQNLLFAPLWNKGAQLMIPMIIRRIYPRPGGAPALPVQS